MALRTIIEDGDAKIADIGEMRLDDSGMLTDSQLRTLVETARALIQKVNAQINLGNGLEGHRAGNLDAQIVSVVASVTSVQIAVPHGLGRVPVGFDVTWRDGGFHVWADQTQAWTESVLYVQVDKTGTFKLRVF